VGSRRTRAGLTRNRVLRRLLAAAAGAVGLVAAFAPGIAEARGIRPDPGFGGRGWVTLRVPRHDLSANAVALLPGGKIVIAGQIAPVPAPPTGDVQVFVAQYRANGRLDPSFAHGGLFVTHLPNSDGPFDATALARDRTGRLLVGGGYGQGSVLAMRLTAAGRLDRSFGPRGRGYATLAVGNIATSMALAPDGKILLGSSNENVPGRPFAVVRLTARGFRDRSFGRAGVAQLLFWNPKLAASSNVGSMAVTAGGGVIGSGHIDYIGGHQGRAGYGKAGIFRLSASGRLVHSFGQRGHVLVGFRFPSGKFKSWFPCGQAVAPNGSITVTGDGATDPPGQILPARLTTAGRLDPSFGTGGRSVLAGPGSADFTACGVVADSARRFTVGIGATLVQLQPNGRPNPAFAPRGRFRIRWPRDVGVQGLASADGRHLVVTGSAGPSQAYLARYTLGPVAGGRG
jgi:uncharacterized delta-60 repeat protein